MVFPTNLFQALGLAWALFILATGPLNAIMSRANKKKQEGPIRKLSAYLSAVRGLTILAAITLLADLLDRRLGLQAFSKLSDYASLAGWTLLTSLVCLGISAGFLLFRKVVRVPFPESIGLLMPRTRNELAVGLGLSGVAGITEEYIFRAFCLLTIISATDSTPVSFLLVTLSFGIGHGYQDIMGVVRATLAGAVLAIPVLVLGTLLPSIIAHVTIDVFSFLIGYSSLLNRWGLVPKSAATT